MPCRRALNHHLNISDRNHRVKRRNLCVNRVNLYVKTREKG